MAPIPFFIVLAIIVLFVLRKKNSATGNTTVEQDSMNTSFRPPVKTDMSDMSFQNDLMNHESSIHNQHIQMHQQHHNDAMQQQNFLNSLNENNFSVPDMNTDSSGKTE